MKKDYSYWVNWLFSRFPAFQNLGAAAYKPGLERVYTLLDALQINHNACPSIHIAGTNGKGSTAAYCAGLLQAKGLQVGLFTSPHIFDFSERIRVNGSAISQEAVIAFCSQFEALNLAIDASFFELTFAMALHYFQQANCDYIVIETGLGGRLDATNVLEPKVAVITNIALDHQEFLGNTLQEIAAEKAGIIKQQTPVVIGKKQEETQAIFMRVSAHYKAPIIYAEDNPLTVPELSLMGYQKTNFNTALNALKTIGFSFSTKECSHMLTNLQSLTGFFGRLQIIATLPTVVIDVSHNPAGIEATLPHIENLCKGQLYILYGASQDKNAQEIIERFPKQAILAACVFQNPRSKTMKEWQALGLETIYSGIQEALKAIQAQMRQEDLLWITGSFFLLSDLPQQKKIF